MAKVYDVIVLGLGVMGSAAAYHLAKDGKRVLVIEQYDLDHRNGSSYGESRIIRYAYDYPIYVEMARQAFPMWREIEKESGRQLMFTTGGLDFGASDYPSLVATANTLERADIPFEWLSAKDTTSRFPQFKLPDTMSAIYQPDAAYLNASQCVITMAQLAKKHGASFLLNTKVEAVEVQPYLVSARTADAEYVAGSIVITAGPWAQKVLSSLDLKLPLQATREEIVFFNPDNGDQFKPENFPVFLYHDDEYFYGLPNVDGNGLKAAVHMRNENTDPDNTRRTPDDDYIAKVRTWLESYIPQAVGPVNEARICLYTMTPDHHFVIDHHPGYPHIVFAGGFSGHGFKFGTLIGRILADLAQKQQPSVDLSMFNVKRFL
jgi:monomeric sarcosine oxidase